MVGNGVTGLGIKIVALAIASAATVMVFSLRDSPEEETPPPETTTAVGDEDTPAEAARAVGAGIQDIQSGQTALREENATLRERLNQLVGQIEGIQIRLTEYAAGEVPVSLPTPGDAIDLLDQPISGIGGGEIVDPVPLTPPPVGGYRWHSSIAPVAIDTAPTADTGAPVVARHSADEETVYVIPAGSLIEARLLTGIVGRIPVNGQVSDPWPFKLVATHVAVAANHTDFDVSGIIFEGVAQGDFAFRCARGQIQRATTVLPDHSIITVEVEQGGWISDAHSNPCLQGALVSNIAAGVSRQAFFNAIAGAADAVARGEETRVVGTDGAEITSITGDAFRVAGADAVAGAADQLREHYTSRSDSWDAIHVPAGQRVIIHIDQALLFKHQPEQVLYDRLQIVRDRTD